jgi:hypothetical protein
VVCRVSEITSQVKSSQSRELSISMKFACSEKHPRKSS